MFEVVKIVLCAMKAGRWGRQRLREAGKGIPESGLYLENAEKTGRTLKRGQLGSELLF